uniref:Uncharacterized protein n=1 Tax=Cannabis sativa TaxID=3483 RepID=A0A803Q381_CANSA
MTPLLYPASEPWPWPPVARGPKGFIDLKTQPLEVDQESEVSKHEGPTIGTQSPWPTKPHKTHSMVAKASNKASLAVKHVH